MQDYLNSRKTESVCRTNDYVPSSRSYCTLSTLNARNPEFDIDTHCTVIAPLNTTNVSKPYKTLERYDDDTETAGNATTVIPPLNTDIRFSNVLPYYKPLLAIDVAQFQEEHPHTPHVHTYNDENFSWAIVTEKDSPLTVAKKAIIHPIQNQRMCGSCWEVSVRLSETRLGIIIYSSENK